MRPLIILFSILLSVLVIGIIGLGLYIERYGLESKVTYLKEMKPAHIKVVREMCTLDADEEIIFFYSADVITPDSNGVVFTNKAIYTYATYEMLDLPSPIVNSAPLSDITEVESVMGTSIWEDTEVTVTYGEDDDYLSFYLPVEDKRDAEFISRLKKMIKTKDP
jgi:hypothetical protein